MTPRLLAALSLISWTTLSAGPARGESMVPPYCTCNDECVQYSWAGPYCQTYGQGSGYCSWSGPGTPCPDGEGQVTLDPTTAPDLGLPEPAPLPEPPPLPEPGYPESDPWYEDLGGTVVLDGGLPPGEDPALDPLPARGGCSAGHAAAPSTASLLLLVGLLGLLRRRRRGPG